MEFTYKSYENLLCLLKEHGYKNCLYNEWKEIKKPAILRHDIDVSLEAALNFSRIEQEYGLRAVYFVLLNTDFYNIASVKSKSIVKEVIARGGVIGLHFDELAYKGTDITEAILYEKNILENILDIKIECVSMHRPSQKTLLGNYKISGMVNSYSDEYFNGFKYLSDSRRNWREDVEDIIINSRHPKLHILTHPFWYNEMELSANDTLKNFICQKKVGVYESLAENIRDVDEFLKPGEVMGI